MLILPSKDEKNAFQSSIVLSNYIRYPENDHNFSLISEKKPLFLPGCSLSRHVLCEDADNSGDNLIGDETTSDEVSPQNSAADIYTDLNETIPDSSNYESLLSVEPVLNRPTANETTTVNATSVKKFVCMIDNLEDETLPLSSFQVISISRTDFSKKIQNKSNIVL